MVALAMKEAVGTIGILAPDDAPLLSLLSLVLPAIAMGNTVVAVPSERAATLMASCTKCSIRAICRVGW